MVVQNLVVQILEEVEVVLVELVEQLVEQMLVQVVMVQHLL